MKPHANLSLAANRASSGLSGRYNHGVLAHFCAIGHSSAMVVSTPSLPPVDTGRLRLRCAEPGDAEALSAMMNDAISRRLASWPVPYTPVMAADRIAGVRMAAAEQRSLPVVVERRPQVLGESPQRRHQCHGLTCAQAQRPGHAARGSAGQRDYCQACL